MFSFLYLYFGIFVWHHKWVKGNTFSRQPSIMFPLLIARTSRFFSNINLIVPSIFFCRPRGEIWMEGKKYLPLFYCRVDSPTDEVQDDLLLSIEMFPTDVCFLSLSFFVNCISFRWRGVLWPGDRGTVTACIVWYKFPFCAERSRCCYREKQFSKWFNKSMHWICTFFVQDATCVFLEVHFIWWDAK